MIYPVIMPSIKLLPFYVTGIGITGSTENVKRPNGLVDNQISIITQGTGELIISGKQYKLQAGSCFYLEKDFPHSYYATNDNFVNKWVVFRGDYMDKLKTAIDKRGYCVFDVQRFDGLSLLFDRIYGFMSRKGQFSQENASVLLYQYIMDFVKLKGGVVSAVHSMQLVVDFIEENYYLDMSLDDIASAFGMSRFELCKEFKKAYGITVFTYLLNIRINQAKIILSNDPNAKIKDIGVQVGFKDASYFIATFKKYEKITPAEFRKSIYSR